MEACENYQFQYETTGLNERKQSSEKEVSGVRSESLESSKLEFQPALTTSLACTPSTTTAAPTTTVIPKTAPIILPVAIIDPTDSPTTSGFPIFPLIGVAFGIIFLVAVGISLFLFCRKQNKPSAGQKGPSKMEEGVSKTASVDSKSKSVVGSTEKTGGNSKIEGKSKIGKKSKVEGMSKIGGKPENSKMTPRNDGRSAFMYTG